MKKLTLLVAFEYALTAMQKECEGMEDTIVRHQYFFGEPLISSTRPKTRQAELEKLQNELASKRAMFNEILASRNFLKDMVIDEEVDRFISQAKV